MHLYMAMRLGYYISPTKSTLLPTQSMVHLGFGIDSTTSSYSITAKYREKFRKFRIELLERGTANLNDLQRWVGKCNHLHLVFPGNSLFTSEARHCMTHAGEDRKQMPQALLDEINFWSFVDSYTEPVPYLLQQHVSLKLCTDASGYGWGATVELPSGPTVLKDYWSSDLFQNDICCKEALAVLFALQSLEGAIFRRRVDVRVDNEGLVHAWTGLKSKSSELVEILQSLFLLTIDLRVDLKMIWISTHENPADAPSRELQRSDSALSVKLRLRLWECYGPFSIDLMALPSNVMRSPSGRSLPFFSRAPAPGSAGCNVFLQSPPKGLLYVFPPFALITPLIRLFMEWGGVTVVMVLPFYEHTRPSWSNLLSPYILDSLALCPPASVGVLNIPSASGFVLNKLPLPFGLKAFRCPFPAVLPQPSAPLPSPIFVVISGDSVLRPLQALKWPAPFRVLVRSISGATLECAAMEALKFSASQCKVLILHAAVNDASKSGADFEEKFPAVCSRACSLISSKFGGRAVLLSTACQSRQSDLNIKIGVANRQLRVQAKSLHWGLISNDNIRYPDLSDNVHLNAAGTAKLHRNILQALKAM